MRCKKILTVLLSFWSMVLFAQQQEVISSAGASFENSSGSISFTIGECISSTLTSPDVILTQGFQQSNLVLIDNLSIRPLGIEIVAYPNPAKEFVILKIDKSQDFSFVLCDLTGRIIEKKDVVKSETEINLNYLDPSVYILKILKDNEEVKTFKIIKL